ncbi:hypothetical protein CONPUDRAFT_159831 [Coniophora puteana RWD-64-598 SS2]|uniref:Uncharacterized protein n=1 Tax=Coniophora puteana (strain RWD-64-598) TaxID=741705 RepID=R7SHI6_CONPW|nr:uncharacterized protein CONPUDRAFT_159831 [Coniophora puteana RWD-64-598 SS2]EIW74534.1 hypothetical protein CONPUDRAFT_159831 [Coniophora puteana RWD-64-598 SS2]
MSLNISSGVPPETPEELFADSIRLIGSTTVCGTWYGLMCAVAAMCVSTLLDQQSSHISRAGRPRRSRSRGRLHFLLAYVGAMWLCGTLYVAGLSRSVQVNYVNHRLFEPGPFAYDDWTSPDAILADVAYWLASVLANGLMVWRMKVILYESRFFKVFMPISILIWAAATILGGVSVVVSSLPAHSFYSTLAQHTTVPAFILSMVLNVFATVCMAGRLFLFRRYYAKHIGNSIPHPQHFTNIAGMLVESCALYSTTSVVFIALYLLEHPAERLVIAILSQAQIIAPLLVLLRISRGIAWDKTTATTFATSTSTATQLDTISFTPGRIKQQGDGNATASESGSHVSGPDARPKRRYSDGLTFAKHELDSVVGAVAVNELKESEV